MGEAKGRRQVDPNYGKKSLKIIFRDLIVGEVFLRLNPAVRSAGQSFSAFHIS